MTIDFLTKDLTGAAKVFYEQSNLEGKEDYLQYFEGFPTTEQEEFAQFLFDLEKAHELTGVEMENVHLDEAEYTYYMHWRDNRAEQLQLLKDVMRALTKAELVTVEKDESSGEYRIEEISAVDAFEEYFIPQHRERLLKDTDHTEEEIEQKISELLQYSEEDKEDELWYQMMHGCGIYNISSIVQLTGGKAFEPLF